MTIVTRIASAFTGASAAQLPRASFDTGLNVTHRWVASDIPAGVGATFTSWPARVGAASLQVAGASIQEDAGQRTAYFNGVTGIASMANGDVVAANLRSVIVIAKPIAGDQAASAGATFQILNTGSSYIQHFDSATATVIPTGSSAAANAALGYWHTYGIASSADGTSGRFFVDNGGSIWGNASAPAALRVASNGSSTFRRLRVLEVIASSDVVTSTQAAALFANAKSFYGGMTWLS